MQGKLVQLKKAVARRINDQSSPMPPGKCQTRCVLKQLIAKAATNLHSHGHCGCPLLDVKDHSGMLGKADADRAWTECFWKGRNRNAQAGPCATSAP
jgi:hypothetical protein